MSESARFRLPWLALLVAAVPLASCSSPASKPSTPITLKLIAFNDFHGNINPPVSPTRLPNPGEGGKPLELATGGIEYLSTLIAELKAQNPLNAVVGAGDLIGGSPLVSALFHHEPAIELLGKAGMEFSSVGNHEFDAGRVELLRMQNGGCRAGGGTDTCVNGTFAGAQFKYLAANVIDQQTGKSLFPGYAIKQFTLRDGQTLAIAFIGLVLKDTPDIVVASGVAGLTFTDEADAANALVPEIRRQGIEAIVVLIHEGGTTRQPQFDDATCPEFAGSIRNIAARLDPAVDVVVSGHTHRAYICREGGRLVTSAGAEGRYVTDIDVTIDPVTRDVMGAVARQVAAVNERLPNPAPHKYPTLTRDARLTPLVNFYNEHAAPLARRKVGRVSAEITRQASNAGESALGDLIADAQLAATRSAGAQVAFMNSGGIRADLRGEQGVVTYSDVFSIHPFGNGLVTLSLTGEQIDAMLEQQWSSETMLQVSAGFSYEWDANAPAGSRIDIARIRFDGAPIDPSKLYRVTVNEFLSLGGDGFVMLRDAPARIRGVMDVDALEQYVAQNSPLSPPAGQRIRRRN